MKKIATFFIGFLFTILLSGCGGDSGSTGGTTSLAGGDTLTMGSSGGMPIGGDASLGGGMDIGALTGGLMGGGGDDDSDDDDSSGGGDDSATNTAPLAFVTLGHVGITYEGQEYSLSSVYSRDRQDIYPPFFVQDQNGTYTINISSYDVREERLYEDTGSLSFAFQMTDLEAKGTYPLLSTIEGESGDVVITDADEFNGKVKLTGYVAGATFYSKSEDSFFTVDLSFQVTVNPLPTAQ